MTKLWESDQNGHQSDAKKTMEAFTVGRDYILDQVLVPYDLDASEVHARALMRAGVLTEEEFQKLKNALGEIRSLWKSGDFRIRIEDEDMHTVIENHLTQKLGDLGKKIHTGRSRNDQVLTALRLYEKEKISGILQLLHQSAEQLLEFADNHRDLPMPGFTHTRKAMLSSVGLWAGSYVEMMIMQKEASSGIYSLINRSPLGTAAGFGTTFPIDREMEAAELGFESPIICSTTAQLSRGWLELQIVQYIQGITSILNRFASDVITYTGEALSFFEMGSTVCTGSSIMPQKKNPDLAELLRGRNAEIAGDATTLQMLVNNLGSGYHRDFQLTKEPVIRSLENCEEMLEAAILLIKNLTPLPENLQKACSSEIFAAESANKLVKEKGISFREAYKYMKENPDSIVIADWDTLKNQYTQLGSPGNPGLEILKKLLMNR
tara:strand:+ start:5352 stop:6656 length:1305 start_codon:yes stop_codon:yes gene_type:complete